MEPLVSVTIVTYNSGKHMAACLEALRLQDYPALEVVVVDNASADDSGDVVERFTSRLPLRLIRNRRNSGFCGGQNQAIAESRGEWVLALNPDVVLGPRFISELIAGIDARNDHAIGAACGRLVSTIPGRLDSTGMYFTPHLRHFDRDGRQEDRGQHMQAEYVFGATGAAALYSRAMIEAISVPALDTKPGGPAEFFDHDFFAYREDADLAWRAQLMGWNCLYVPTAVGSHVRTCTPENRRQMAPAVNMHSVKNRFLMRIKNIGVGLYLRHFLPITLRDLSAVAYCLLKERTSLPGLWYVLENWSKTQAKRRWIQSRRRRSDRVLSRWFRFEPVALSEPLPLQDSLDRSLQGESAAAAPKALAAGASRRP